MKNVGILHYASPPTVGGVEWTIYYHALELAALSYPVRVVSGRGEDFHPQIPTHVEPLFDSKHPDVLAVKNALDAGTIPEAFEPLVERMVIALEATLAGCDVCIVHNVPTLNKNLPLTVALKRYAEQNSLYLLAWCHDLAWTNPQYLPELYDKYPWELLKQTWANTRYITVSEPRRGELAQLFGMAEDTITVVFPGVDPAVFYHWTSTTQHLDAQLNLLDADGILLLPARITRRKNIELAIRVLAAIRDITGQDYRLLVTGPPGPHNPTNRGYLGELLDLCASLTVNEAVHFVYAFGEGDDSPLIPDNPTMANFYHLADALLFTSIQEGFGIPVIEAGFAGLPVFCSDIPPFRASGQGDVHYFDPVNDPPEQIAQTIVDVLTAQSVTRLRVRVRKSYRWKRIVRDQLVPLIERG